jgi:hypothetical protein
MQETEYWFLACISLEEICFEPYLATYVINERGIGLLVSEYAVYAVYEYAEQERT